MSNENVKPDAAAAPAAFTLTHDLVKSWSPCTDGYRWFLGKFPQGGAYTAVHAALRQDNRFDDAGWLFRAALSHALSTTPAVTVDLVAAQDDDATKLIEATSPTKIKAPAADDVKVVVENDNGDDSAQIGSSGNGAQIGSSGDYARIGSSGDYARIGSSGYGAQIGSSGNDAQIGSSGDYAQIGSSGYGAQIGSSGNGARIGSSGYGAQIGSSGDYARIGSSGDYARIGSSGYGAQIGSSGNDAQIGSSGDYAQIGSSGNGARINTTGERATIACAGLRARAKAGKDGAIALAYWDERSERTRFAVGYVGESIEADKWYSVTEEGEFVEAAHE